MAYDTETLFKKAIQIIEKDKDIVFLEDVICELGISKPTYYLHFPKGTEQFESIKGMLQRNATNTKRQLRKNWKDSNSSASLQIALYKLLATEKELERLNPTKEKSEEFEAPKPLVEWTNSN